MASATTLPRSAWRGFWIGLLPSLLAWALILMVLR